MFLVSDGSREKRKQIISRITKIDVTVGMLLSAVDLEWTLRRAILKLSGLPTKEVRKRLEGACGISSYKAAWKELVCLGRSGFKSIVAIVDDYGKDAGAKSLWKSLLKAFSARNIIVHGVKGVIRTEDVVEFTDTLQSATDSLAAYCEGHGENVFERLKVRRTKSKV